MSHILFASKFLMLLPAAAHTNDNADAVAVTLSKNKAVTQYILLAGFISEFWVSCPAGRCRPAVSYN